MRIAREALRGRCLRIAAVAIVVSSLAACSASRPVVYPNEKTKRVGPNVVADDIDECMRRAREFAGGGRGGEVARDTAGRTVVGAGVGAAAGAAGGAIYGDAARGAASGAAGGAAAGMMSGLFSGWGRNEPDPVFKNFVTRCLNERGYEVIGWR